ncbi:MAG: hypothetical protein OEV12_09690 [Gammaproteobacteria bacterium]|jgi:hypothetical protein|nr:hypothetical protein [Gammaproteobacteria bacterium]MDH3971987.1 hypothetical protein [Gammaproteobacteria bacterium]MDH3986672.1 hypothetical protein [Gammaproteobacteria bacterium]
MSLPDTKEQILQSHTGLIHRVVMHCNNPGSVPDMEQVLQMAADNDWTALVSVIRDIMSGNRDESILLVLDEEDRVIAESILQGLQDPNTLPSLETDIDSDMAAPGIAGLVHASRNGNAQALQIIGNMAKQMLEAGGDMGILAGRIRPLVDGERDADKLTENMTDKGQKLMLQVLEELLKLEAN